MDKIFFGKQVERLRGVYSRESMNDERINVLWEKFKFTENRTFQSAMDYMIGEYTTQALPSLSRIVECVSSFRPKGGAAVSMQELLPAHICEACRDFGFGFVGDMVVSCICEAGVRIGPDEMVRHQVAYERGRRFVESGTLSLPELPYDPGERIGIAETVNQSSLSGGSNVAEKTKE